VRGYSLSPTIVNIVQTNALVSPMILELVDRLTGNLAPPDEVIDLDADEGAIER